MLKIYNDYIPQSHYIRCESLQKYVQHQKKFSIIGISLYDLGKGTFRF
jgi:hypothetical protein